MAITLTVQGAYASVAEADAFLSNDDVWLELEENVKEDALLWGRYYIDTKFTCTVDSEVIPEEFKFANTLLAKDYTLQGDLFFDNEDSVKKKFVKAGEVESETTYMSGKKSSPASVSKSIAVLHAYCSDGSTLKRV